MKYAIIAMYVLFFSIHCLYCSEKGETAFEMYERAKAMPSSTLEEKNAQFEVLRICYLRIDVPAIAHAAMQALWDHPRERLEVKIDTLKGHIPHAIREYGEKK